MQAILTKLLSPTNTKGTRIKATCARGSLIVSYPHELSGESVHAYAANCLCDKFVAEDSKTYGSDALKNPWTYPRVCGCLRSGEYAHVFTEVRK